MEDNKSRRGKIISSASWARSYQMLLKRIGKKLGLVGASLVLISAQLTPFFVFGGQASAQVTDYVIDGKIRICHRTSAANNPYTSNNISVSAADGESGNSGNESDHYGEHKEELAATKEIAEELKNNHEDWGDIIPPIINVHDGLNWTTEGIAMWENDCNFVEDDTTVQVMKVLSPNIGMFDLYVNGSKVVTDAINNSTSEKVKIDPSKNVEVKEKPGTGLTNLMITRPILHVPTRIKKS